METSERSLLYIDMAYTMEIIKAKKHHEFLESRHSNGYFKKVWGVHPLADIADGKSKGLQIIEFSSDQTVIEGAAAAMPWTKLLLPLNFLVSQYRLVRLLSRLIKRNDISVIASTDPFYGGLLGLILKKIRKKPLVIYVYANYDDIYQDTGNLAMPRLIPSRFLEKKISRLVFTKADLVVGGNKNNLSYAVNNGAGKKMTAVFPVSKNMYKGHILAPEQRKDGNDVLKQFNIPLNRKYLLFVGRLLDVKRPDDAVKAMKVVIEKDPSVIGILAGEGPMRKTLENMIKSAGLSASIFLVGSLSQDNLSYIIPKCITLSPLTGMALIECGLGGSPVVAYDRDWQSEFINDGVNGFIVKFKDYEAMGKKAIQIIEDNELRNKFSSNVRETALGYADAEKLYAHEHEVFEELFRTFHQKQTSLEIAPAKNVI